LPDFTGPGAALPPREALDALLEGFGEVSLFLEFVDFLVLVLVIARPLPIAGSTFSLSASRANVEVELDTGRPKEREELECAERGLEATQDWLATGGSWYIVNVGAIVGDNRC
jgi:hypothetical protein